MCHDLLGNSSRKKHWKDVIILLNSTACLSKNWPQQESVYFSLTVLWYVQIIKYILTRWSYSFVCTSYYFIIIIMETYLKVLNFWNACHVNSFSSVYLRLSQFSESSFVQYMGLCVFNLPISLMMNVRIYVLYLIIIIIRSEVWHTCHCLGLGHETMICAACHFILLSS